MCLGSSGHADGPEEQLIEAVQVALGKNFITDWSGLDALPGIKWAPLPPTSLQTVCRIAAVTHGKARPSSDEKGRVKSISSINQYGNRVPMPFSTALW